MKRYFILGGVCLVAGFALNTCVRSLARSEPAYALAGDRMGEQEKRSLKTFGEADEDAAMEMAPAAPPPMQVAAAPAQAGGVLGNVEGGGGRGPARTMKPGAPPPPPRRRPRLRPRRDGPGSPRRSSSSRWW
jgi:hypothetical protein